MTQAASNQAAASEHRAHPSSRPMGKPVTIDINGRTAAAYVSVHNSGSGPGLLLIGDSSKLDAGLQARADLFAEEGYSVLLIGNDHSTADVAAAADAARALETTDGGLACVGFGSGGMLAIDAAAQAQFAALVAFDSIAGTGDAARLAAVPCPFVLHFGTRNAPENIELARNLRSQLARKDGSRILDWEEGPPGFTIPGRASYARRADDLAHTRTLDLLRRVLGPYYDYVTLFAEHIYHEFETRDVDATMATMIDEPYVNHVPTLAGGVGHDMLKRFYKYHFVEQNGGGRDRVRISYTSGSDRLVLETYTKFVHDSVIDRYFPGIEPTGKLVETATVIVVKFRGGKVCHEHLYWDQGSVLKQIGVLDTGNLPIAGPEAARKVLDETQPSNIFMQEAWAQSEGKPI